MLSTMIVDDFLTYLQAEKNYSLLTQQCYRDDLQAFEKFFRQMDSDLQWETVDADVVRDWMEEMMDKGNTATTINRRLSALRSFYRFALARHYVTRDPVHNITGPKKAKPLPQFVKESEMDRLLDQCQWENTFKDVRARTILMMFYVTGLRVSELVSLDDTMVDWVNSQLKVTGKRDKQRVIPFGEELRVALRSYLSLRDQEVRRQGDALFVTEKGERMTADKVRRLVQHYLTGVTTLKKRSPHVLRHSFATAMLNHEAGLETVKKLLGHQSLSTTEIYTHTTFEQLKKVYKSAHPRD